MPKITLDEVEYDSDDFNDDQSQLLNEISFNNNLQTQMRYQLQGLEGMNNAAVGKLKESLTAKEE
jgi:hypothetical protein